MSRPLLAAALALALLPGCSGSKNSSTQTGQGTATLSVTRKSRFVAMALGVNVYVNGARLGSVGNGSTQSFTFVPDARGNTLKLTQEPAIGWNTQSEPVAFQVAPGGSYAVSCHIESGLTKVKIIVERPDSGSGGVVLPLVVVSTDLHPAVRKVAVDTEDVVVPRGVTRTIKKSRTIAHSVTLTQRQALEGTLRAGITALSAEVKGSVESQLGRTFKETETVEQEVRFDGSAHQKFRLTWLDRIRTGTVRFRDGGAERTTPFEFREGTELRIEPLP